MYKNKTPGSPGTPAPTRRKGNAMGQLAKKFTGVGMSQRLPQQSSFDPLPPCHSGFCLFARSFRPCSHNLTQHTSYVVQEPVLGQFEPNPARKLGSSAAVDTLPARNRGLHGQRRVFLGCTSACAVALCLPRCYASLIRVRTIYSHALHPL